MPQFKFSSSNASSSSSSSAPIDPEHLPGDRIDREGTDELAAQAFTAGCTAMGGPAAGMVCDWYTHGGAEWLMEGFMSLLPDSWKAQGTFDWVSYVVEPIRRKAMLVWLAEFQGTKDAYRLLLEQLGYVGKTQRTPDHLLWKNVSKRIKDAPPDGFPVFVLKLAREKFGMNDEREYFDGVQGFAKVRSVTDCRNIMGGVIDWGNYFCVKLDGISATPEESDVKRLGDTLANLLQNARNTPMRQAVQMGLDSARIAAQDAHGLRGGILKKITLKPTGAKLPPAGVVVPALACGTIIGGTWYFLRRRR